MKIKKGDTVIMLSGKDRAKTGKVLRTDPKAHKVIVEGLNMVKRHLRPRKAGSKGQIVSVERWVSASAVAVASKDTGKAARVGWQLGADGKTKVRIDRKTKIQI
ncbi:MAG: 50S ribosomal protein L24 [Candidatus Yanofskybacteria bacterium]|nr:50S ribosomal protein L24 [Candidatus Yanofskybacteria bacterium]